MEQFEVFRKEEMSTEKNKEINRGKDTSPNYQQDDFEYQQKVPWNSFKYLEKKI